MNEKERWIPKFKVGDIVHIQRIHLQPAFNTTYVITKVSNTKRRRGYSYAVIPQLTYVFITDPTHSFGIGSMSSSCEDNISLVTLVDLCAKRQYLDDMINDIVKKRSQ